MATKPFNVGDQVSFIDDDLEGQVVAVDGKSIVLETSEGFVIQVAERELMHSQKMERIDISQEMIETVKRNDSSKRKGRKTTKREKSVPPMEVDLHIHHLVQN